MSTQIPRDRPDVEEVEVTDAMIEAGREVYDRLSPDYYREADILTRIYRVMRSKERAN